MFTLVVSHELAERLFIEPHLPWFAPAGFRRGMLTDTFRLSSEVEMRPEVRVWCSEFLDWAAFAFFEAHRQSYTVQFGSENDLIAFKIRWW